MKSKNDIRIYQEDQWTAKVNVIEEQSCGDNFSYILKIIETLEQLEENPIFSRENGKVFCVNSIKKLPQFRT